MGAGSSWISSWGSAPAALQQGLQLISDEQLQILLDDFQQIDEDGSGKIQGKELEVLLKGQLGRAPTAAEMTATLDKHDLDEDGCIDFGEYVAWLYDFPDAAALKGTAVTKEMAKGVVAEHLGDWDDEFGDTFDQLADGDTGMISAAVWNQQILEQIPVFNRKYASSEAIEKHVFGWAPEKVHVFIAGFNRYDGDAQATWSDEGRLDKELHSHFVNTVGVPAAQAVLLMDGDGTVANVKAQLTAVGRRASKGDLLFIYWGSHGSLSMDGDRGYDYNTYSTKAYDGWISGSEIAELIDEEYAGSHVFMATDTCYSGAMNEILSIKAEQNENFRAAVLSSTSMYQTAWSAWRFARCLLRGLRGEGIVRATLAIVEDEDKEARSVITLEDLATYTRSEMAFLADGHPEFANAEFALSARQVVVANVSYGPHRGSKRGSGKWDIGDRVMVDGQRAQIIDLNDGNAVVEMGGRDGGQTRSVLNDGTLPKFTWRTYEEGTSVELRWDKWKEFHPNATVLEEFEHLHLLTWDEPHSECNGPDEKWVANNMIRLPGESQSANASLVLSGAGCETVNGTYVEDDVYKGRALYTNKTTGLQIWWNGQWRLGTTNNYYYQLDASETCVCGSKVFPWEVATFSPNASTCGPAPIVDPGSVLVSGAGADLVNGQYLIDDVYKGRPLYANKKTGLQVWFNGRWIMGTTNSFYYLLDAGEICVFGSPDDKEFGLWQVATVCSHVDACTPAPIVSMFSGR